MTDDRNYMDVYQEMGMDFSIDHVTVAGRNVEALTQSFTDAGFSVAYGGSHSNGVTHMAIVGFQDGSYIELISTLEPNAESPWWNTPIHGNGGPCAWAVSVDDIAATSITLRERGIVVEGPSAYERERPDGALVEWELSFLGEGDPGSMLPFFISDRTPRKRRVEPTGGLAESSIIGVDTVMLAVRDLGSALDRFETAFDLERSVCDRLSSLDAEIASFVEAPVTLAEPRGDGWLSDRISRFGIRPVAYILGIDGEVPSGFDVTTWEPVANREVGWLSLTEPVGRPYIGVVDVDR